LFVSNSGNGSISRVEMDASSAVVLQGVGNPYGLSLDSANTLRFIDHATGAVYGWAFSGAPALLGSISPYGGTYTASGFSNELYITDVVRGELLVRDSMGGIRVFASGFIGKETPPVIGPNGLAYDGCCKLYVADGDSIYVITPRK
jgi:hypothetical protein